MAAYKGIVGRLTSAHAGNLWILVLSIYADDEKKAEVEQLTGKKRTHDEAANKGKDGG